MLRHPLLVAAPEASLFRELRALLPECDCFHAADAEQALALAQDHTPAVVLLSEGLPTKRGGGQGMQLGPSQVLGLLRDRPELAATRFAYLGTEALESMVLAGADAVVVPSSAKLVAMQLRNLLLRAQQVSALQSHISELKQGIKTWEADEKARDQLVHMLVHDLKNPIGAVQGLIDLVISEPEGLSEDSIELLKTAREETQHLLYLTVNMLDVRKMQAGKMNLRRSALYAPMVADVLKMSIADVGGGVGERELSTQIDPELSPMHADPEVLRRIMTNLISNAVKHTMPGGKVKVKVENNPEGTVKVTVRDDGEGIPAEDLDKLFQDFGQSPATIHGRFDTGMGLSFCKLAVETHGGEISARSKIGVGSEFVFTLPAYDVLEDDDYVELLR